MNRCIKSTIPENMPFGSSTTSMIVFFFSGLESFRADAEMGKMIRRIK